MKTPEFIDNTPYDPIGRSAPSAPDAQALAEEKPIAVEINAQEIGGMFARGCGRFDFRDFLMGKLRAAGVPMKDSVIAPAVAHGAVYKVKEPNPERPRVFRYVWMPENYVRGMQVATRNMGN